ncbi:MAG: SPOR domain-containing protein [Mariprofundaceae bacterium]|nr:SPOR domain-containing protein [Mariprofundaceae bacterium]
MVFMPLQSLNATAEYMSKQTAYDLLKLNQSEKVLALAKGDREVLLATLELEHEQVDAALAWLSTDVIQANPLAALIKGEAFRRKSFAAALRAGSYAHAAHDGIKKLGNAEFTPALREAEKRLQAFMLIDSASMLAQEEQTDTLTAAVRASVESAVQLWIKDWQSLNHKAYMSHFDVSFQTDKYNYQSWSQHKQRINRKKAFIHIQISDIKIVTDANVAGEAVIVSFRQRYQSSNYNSNDYKELYLLRRHAGAAWLILDEGKHVYPERFHVKEAHNIKPLVAGWVINIGSFQSMKNAEKMLEVIKHSYLFQTFVVSVKVAGKKVYRVQSGLYHTRPLARHAMLDICAKLEVAGCWLEKNI